MLAKVRGIINVYFRKFVFDYINSIKFIIEDYKENCETIKDCSVNKNLICLKSICDCPIDYQYINGKCHRQGATFIEQTFENPLKVINANDKLNVNSASNEEQCKINSDCKKNFVCISSKCICIPRNGEFCVAGKQFLISFN